MSRKENRVLPRRIRYLQPNWTPWQEDTDSRRCVRVGAKSISLRFKDIVDACTCFTPTSLSWVGNFIYYTFTIHLTKINRMGEGWVRLIEQKGKKRQEESFAAWRFSQHGTSVSWSFNPFSSQSTFVRVKNGEEKKNVIGRDKQPTFGAAMEYTIIVFRRKWFAEYLCMYPLSANTFLDAISHRIAKRLRFNEGI